MTRIVLLVFSLLALVVLAQPNVRGGQVVRAPASVTTDPAAAYGIGQYAFTRCIMAPGGPSSSSLHRTGLNASGSPLLAAPDAGSRWANLNRQIPDTQTSSSAINFLNQSDRVAWQGYADGGGGGNAGFTAWIRFGHETMTDAGLTWAGVAYDPGSSNCAGDGWGTNANNRPVGILVECPWDGGATVLHSYTDAGKTTVELGGGDGGVLTCVPGRGFDFILSNEGGGSDDYLYTFTELDSGVSASGTITNPVDYYPMSLILRTCNLHTVTTSRIGIVSACISTNY